MATKELIRAADGVQPYLDVVAGYDREFKKWESRVEKLLKRYRDDRQDGRRGGEMARFNILWSNVNTLVPACFSRLPQPDVSRRFRDQDPIGRVASLILERALDYEVQHYGDYRATMRAAVYDRFLGGRGVAWVRYEPHFRAAEQGSPTDGVEVTEDIDEPQEELDYECAPVDYVHWRDFGHSVARTWEEVTVVYRRVYMTRDALIERFGEEIGRKVPLDSKPEELKKTVYAPDDERASRALVLEFWDKSTKKAVWISKSLGQILDERDDPLGLNEFFPCPRPLYATLVSDSLVPTPDYALYQDQATELDVLSDRIDGLVKALKVSGVYDASMGPELARLFTEGENNALLPVKSWAAFAERQGLKGAIDIVDLTPIAGALQVAYAAREEIKAQIYEITGISDIIRGQTAASETATAQQIKGQYASLRLRQMQLEVAEFATELLRLKAQVMCGKFSPDTLLQMAAADQLSPTDQQYIPQAMELLSGGNPLRSFRIEVAADSLVQIDEQAEKQSRVEFLTSVGGFMEKAQQVVMAAPQMGPLVMDLLQFGVRGFKVGKTIEGAFDQAAEQMRQQAATPKPPPVDPKLEIMRQQHAERMQEMQTQHAQKMEQDRALFEMDIAAKREEGALSREHEMARSRASVAAEEARAARAIHEKLSHVEYQVKPQVDVVNVLREAQGVMGQAATQMAQAAQMMAEAASTEKETVAERGADGKLVRSVTRPVRRQVQ